MAARVNLSQDGRAISKKGAVMAGDEIKHRGYVIKVARHGPGWQIQVAPSDEISAHVEHAGVPDTNSRDAVISKAKHLVNALLD